MKNNKMVFALSEARLRALVWTVKNYGRTPEEEKDVTEKEFAEAKRLTKEYLGELEEGLANSLEFEN